MANKRPKPEEIVSKLRQVEVLMGQGMSRLDAIRQIGVVEQTYYRWRKQYDGMGIDQLKELNRLQKIVSLHEVLCGQWTPRANALRPSRYHL